MTIIEEKTPSCGLFFADHGEEWKHFWMLIGLGLLQIEGLHWVTALL